MFVKLKSSTAKWSILLKQEIFFECANQACSFLYYANFCIHVYSKLYKLDIIQNPKIYSQITL